MFSCLSMRTEKDGDKLTWIHPLHAVGECVVCDQVVASPSGVGDDYVCGRERYCAEQRYQ